MIITWMLSNLDYYYKYSIVAKLYWGFYNCNLVPEITRDVFYDAVHGHVL